MLRRAGCSLLVDMRRLSIPLLCFVHTLALASALASIGAHGRRIRSRRVRAIIPSMYASSAKAMSWSSRRARG